jgi:hypothetical protein
MKKPVIEEAFGKIGKIERVHMPTVEHGRNKGKNKGFCFITYEKKEDAEKAVAEMHDKEFEGFTLAVEIAKSKKELKPKVKSEIVNTTTPTPGPEDHDAASPVTNPEAKDDEPRTGSTLAPVPVSQRSIGLMNIPDTVRDDHIKALVEPFGYKKIVRMLQHGGAIIEFLEPSSVGKAGLALEGYEIAPGKKIRVGTVAELKKEKAEYRPPTTLMKPVQVRRPVAAGAGRGRGRGGKPGLGLGRGIAMGGASATTPGDGEKKEAKTNDDFRAMLLGGKKTDGDGDSEMKE